MIIDTIKYEKDDKSGFFFSAKRQFQMEHLPPIGYFLGTSENAGGTIQEGYAIFNSITKSWSYSISLTDHSISIHEHEESLFYLAHSLKIYIKDGWDVRLYKEHDEVNIDEFLDMWEWV